MTRGQVVDILLQYRSNVAKAQYYAAQTQLLERKLERARDSMIMDCISITPKMTGMPHATGVSDKVGDLAVKLADGYETQQVMAIRKSLQAARDKQDSYHEMVMYADAWLKCLTDRQRFVLCEKTIKGSYVRDVIRGMEKRYGETYTRNSIKRIENSAIDAIFMMVRE